MGNLNARQLCPKVVVIILTYNGLKWLDGCFGSLLKTDYPNYELLVVDNDSQDETCQYIREKYPNIEIIENKINVGTAKGNNIGMRYAISKGADYVVLLNQDIIVTENWLSEMVKIAESEKDIGILSPIQYDYRGESIDPGFEHILKKTKYFEDLSEGSLEERYWTHFVVGASILIKRSVMESIGLLDPFYYMYWEDNDYCRRVIYRGFKIACVTKSRVFHNHSLVKRASFPHKTLFRLGKNNLIWILKDPNNSFFFNIKNAFVWTDWGEFFEEFQYKYWEMAKAFCILWVLMPVIYRKYVEEKIKPCYLEES